ncbi:FABP family protein [Corynebacterium lubricantis]|uniref:FABP family protein n=1 Tax=Corynebacterium lubricantis TaxID=541095 RepID=UPI0003643B7C|nr:FABP family protein [Corynebacterium lubricantis]
MELHDNVAPFAFLAGEWVGAGSGHYPTIESFSYSETLTFTTVPNKPFFRYEQKTQSPEGNPMHTEVGFLRPTSETTVEFIIAQPTGQTELLEGVVERSGEEVTFVFTESQVVNSSSAKHVDATARRYHFDTTKTVLTTEFSMQAVGQEMQNHLRSELEKR